MNNLDDYKTGNPGMDAKIEKALQREKNRHIDSVNLDLKLRLQQLEQPQRSKYNIDTSDKGKEKRTYHDGTLFASITEMNRWDYLRKIERAGEIDELERQVEFILLEPFHNEQWGEIKHIMYVADFVYINLTFRKNYFGRKCVEDSKGGVLTPEYKLKKKLFLKRYGKDLLFFEV